MPDLYLAVVVPLKMQETAGGESAEEVQLSTNLKNYKQKFNQIVRLLPALEVYSTIHAERLCLILNNLV